MSTVGAGGGSVPWATQVPLDIDGTLVSPGDLAFSDPINGVVVIPQDKVSAVVELLPRLTSADDKVKEELLQISLQNFPLESPWTLTLLDGTSTGIIESAPFATKPDMEVKLVQIALLTDVFTAESQDTELENAEKRRKTLLNTLNNPRHEISQPWKPSSRNLKRS